jgi:hypothetical protein
VPEGEAVTSIDKLLVELGRIAKYPDGLVTPFEWQAVAEKMQDIAAHALHWRDGQKPLPELKHKDGRE